VLLWLFYNSIGKESLSRIVTMYVFLLK